MQCSLPALHLLWILFIILTEQARILLCQKTGSYKWKVSLRESSDLSQHGIAEISNDGELWATIYPSQRGWKVGSVVCRQLGLGPLSSASIVYDAMKRVLYSVTCSGKEKSLSDCYVNTRPSHSYFSVLRVECLPVNAEEFDVTLVKSYDFLDEGVVFFFVNGQWGPSCTPKENQNLVCVTMCRQLGFIDCGHHEVEFSGEILSDPILENVSCSSTAYDLQDCNFDIIQRKACTHHDGTFLEVACERRYIYSSDSDSYDYPFPIPSQNPPSGGYHTALYLVTLFVVTIAAVLLYLRRKNSFDPSISMVPRISETRADSQQEASLLPSYEAATANGSYPLASPPENSQPPGYSHKTGYTLPLQLDSSAQPRQVHTCETQPGPSILDASHSDLSGPVGNGEAHGASNAEFDNNMPGTDTGVHGTPSSDPELPTYEEAVARCNDET